MMSSEDDCEVAFLDKCFKNNKPKRVRQRVDAGEPRNSYAAIPNFTSRPTNGYIVSSAGSKLISDLLARQRAAENAVCGMMTVEEGARMNGNISQSPGGPSPGVLNLGKPKGNPFFNGSDESAELAFLHHQDELAENSHLLRSILQDRKSFVEACGGGVSPCSTGGESEGSDDEEDSPPSPREQSALSNLLGEFGHASEVPTRCGSAPPPNNSSVAVQPADPGEKEDCDDDDRMSERRGSESSSRSPSPKSVRDSLEIKRARVETIVSNMLPMSSGRSPSLNGSAGLDQNTPVNGCKKRKLYQPQQHEASKLASPAVTNGDLEEEYNDDTEDDAVSPAKRRPDEQTLKTQLKQMQKQLAIMQQRYLELFEATRNESNGASPIRSDDQELTSVDEQINQDCDTDKRKSSEAAQVREDNMTNGLPNVYFHSTPKDCSKENNLDDKSRQPEARQSCIVKSNSAGNSQPVSPSGCTTDLEWLVDALKSEISNRLSQVIDSIVSKYAQRRTKTVQHDEPAPPANPPAPVPPQAPSHQPHKEFNLLSQMLDRKSPRTKVIDRGNRVNGHSARMSPYPEQCSTKSNLFFSPSLKGHLASYFNACHPAMPPTSQGYNGSNPVSSGPTSLLTTAVTMSSSQPTLPPELPEQTEAMSLVVAPKKKRHKVTDTRITPRTVSRLLGQELETPSKYQHLLGSMLGLSHEHAINYHNAALLAPPPPPPLVPVTLPTTVAIPNPSLHQSEVFSALQYEAHRLGHYSQEQVTDDDSLLHGSPSLHSSMMGGPHGSPDSMSYGQFKQENGEGSDAGDSQTYDSGLAMTSTLTPMHLRKAKLMFFYVRYPSSAILKMYFPDIKFNKNNTAQLVKWFSNFREFYYIQMEKYARQAISDGVKNCEDIKVPADAELIRVLNLHYNRNNHIEVPENFRYVAEMTLREFFKSIYAGKDQEQSWKKAIYKVIARLDDGVPEYFKSPNFLEQLE